MNDYDYLVNNLDYKFSETNLGWKEKEFMYWHLHWYALIMSNTSTKKSLNFRVCLEIVFQNRFLFSIIDLCSLEQKYIENIFDNQKLFYVFKNKK